MSRVGIGAPLLPGGVLFLDIALRTGFAYGTLADLDHGPRWGVWELPTAPSLGRRIVAFENGLADAIAEFQPAVVAIEAPLAAGAKGSAETARLLICLAGAAEATAYRWEREYRERSVMTIRAQVCGRAMPNEAERDDRVNAKDAIVAPWIQARGWNITDHNARDAAVGWAYEMGVRHPRFARGR